MLLSSPHPKAQTTHAVSHDPVAWWAFTPQAACQHLGVDAAQGLRPEQIQAARVRYGANVLPRAKARPLWLLFLSQFHNPLSYLLLGATGVAFWVKDPVDAAVIFVVVVLNAIIGFIQEAKAEQSTQALAQRLKMTAQVVRNGDIQRIDAHDLVPGDVLQLQAGDKVPADVRLLHGRDLCCDESPLTGESIPVEKQPVAVLSADAVLGDRVNMAYAGTSVTYGAARALVVETGIATELGRISELLGNVKPVETPLTQKMAQFSQRLLWVILLLAAATFAWGLWQGQTLGDMVMIAITLAVSMIPEGLPAALTVTMAIGVSHMARRKAIVRYLPAVETLGSTTTICSDKTGTLTQNQMTVQVVVAGLEQYVISGTGYAPQGRIAPAASPGQPLSPDALPPLLRECLRAGLLCNDSQLLDVAGTPTPQGDPTEVALWVSAAKAAIGQETRAQTPRLDTLPFDSARQLMATAHPHPERAPGMQQVYVKGSVEAVLTHCDRMADNTPLASEAIHRCVEELARKGLRVLAFARAHRPEGRLEWHTLGESPGQAGLEFLGLQAMMDPPRPEAIAAVATCQQAGIVVKMITGDHPVTAVAIAEALGLAMPPVAVVSGHELAAMPESALPDLVQRVCVFARVSPEQKLRLVSALQAQGQVVAMTGDGVNDAPALKQADIGVAMGITGTDVSKEAADMILTDDNFASIVAAVEEGRRVFDNLVKQIAWMLPTNMGIGLIVLAATFLAIPLPILPIQALWINTTSAGLLGLSLAFEPKEPLVMSRPPRKPGQAILTQALFARVVMVGLLIALSGFVILKLELLTGALLPQARTATVNALVMMMMACLLASRSLTQPCWRVPLRQNPWIVWLIGLMLVLQSAMTYVPWFQQVFETAALPWQAWARMGLVSLVLLLFVEAEKAWSQRRSAPHIS